MNSPSEQVSSVPNTASPDLLQVAVQQKIASAWHTSVLYLAVNPTAVDILAAVGDPTVAGLTILVWHF
jgi:hypothetical protein